MSYVKLIIYQSYVRERCTEHLYALHYYTQLHTEWAENRRSWLLCVSWPNNNTQTNQPVSQPEREGTERDVNPDREIRKRTYCTHYQTPKKLLRPTLVKIIWFHTKHSSKLLTYWHIARYLYKLNFIWSTTSAQCTFLILSQNIFFYVTIDEDWIIHD